MERVEIKAALLFTPSIDDNSFGGGFYEKKSGLIAGSHRFSISWLMWCFI